MLDGFSLAILVFNLSLPPHDHIENTQTFWHLPLSLVIRSHILVLLTHFIDRSFDRSSYSRLSFGFPSIFEESPLAIRPLSAVIFWVVSIILIILGSKLWFCNIFFLTLTVFSQIVVKWTVFVLQSWSLSLAQIACIEVYFLSQMILLL